MESNSKPLTGLRVLDLTRLLPGPVCTLHLADLGAEVIKVEDTVLGDYARDLGSSVASMSPLFCAINRNKKSISVNLKEKSGKKIFNELIKSSDVLIEGFRPGVMHKLGFDYENCKKIKPSLVYCSISGYGQDGPQKSVAGHDVNYIAVAGILDQIGVQNERPVIPNIQIGDILGGALVPAMTILAALFDVNRSGKGRNIDVSMTDAVFAHNFQALSNMVTEGNPGHRGDQLLSGSEAGYNVYETSDKKYIAVGALEKKFWNNLCELVERGDLKKIHWSKKNANKSYGISQLKKIFMTKTRDEWVSIFQGSDCCVTPVLSFDEAIEYPQLKSREMIFYEAHPNSHKTLQFNTPFKMSDFKLDSTFAAPLHGQHTMEILKNLGFSKSEIQEFRDAIKVV